jgi:hypothetical protein
MNTRVLLPGLLLLASVACLAPKQKAEFETKLHRWVGRPAAEFIQANGNPSTTTARPEGGNTYLFATVSLKESHLVYREYTNYTTGEKATVPPGGSLPQSMQDGAHQVRSRQTSVPLRSNLYCRVTLETDAKDIILATRYEGNDCW